MSIKKLPNGKYFLYTTDVRENKVRLRFNKKEDAEALESIIKTEKYEKKLVKVGLRKAKYLISDCLEDFRISKSLLQPKSVQKYSAVIKQFKFFVDKLAIKYVDEFNSEHGTMFYNELIKEVSITKNGITQKVRSAPKTINFYLQTVKAFFQEEVVKDHILKSPVLHLRNAKVAKKKPEFYTIEELKKIFSQEMVLAYRHFFLGLFYTGMRFAEVANLTWHNVDFEQKLIYVRPGDGHTLKTEKSERAIPINNELLVLLTTIYKTKLSELVFVTSAGTEIRERKALKIIKEVAEKAGVDSRAFLHKFRSTFATLLVRNKVPLESIKELLGHSSITMTEKAYANNESSRMHNDVSVLDNILD